MYVNCFYLTFSKRIWGTFKRKNNGLEGGEAPPKLGPSMSLEAIYGLSGKNNEKLNSLLRYRL